MNRKDSHDAWLRLAKAARRADEDAGSGEMLPSYGFAARTAALGLDKMPSQSPVALFAGFSMRALCVASLVAALLVSINLGPILHALDDEATALGESAAPVVTLDSENTLDPSTW